MANKIARFRDLGLLCYLNRVALIVKRPRNLVVCGIIGLVGCGPGGPSLERSTDDGSADTSGGGATSEPTADETDGGADAGSTDEAGSGSEESGSTGAEAVPLCFTKTTTIEAHSAVPVSLDSDGRSDLAVTGISINGTAPLQLLLNEGDSWTEIGAYPLGELGRFELLDADLDGLTDVVIHEGDSADYFHNVGGAFDDPVPVDTLFLDATLVDVDGDALPDVVKFLGNQVEVFARNADGSGEALGTFDLPSPDPAAPIGDSCEDWILSATIPSMNSPHSLRGFSRYCDTAGPQSFHDVVEFAPDGSPTWLGELATDSGLSPRWVGDADLDGALDVLESSGRLSRFVDGELVELVDFGGFHVTMGDLDGDGLMDAVAADDAGSRTDPPTAEVRLGAEAWSVHTTVEGGRPEAIADFDGDGDNDILIHDWLIGVPYILSTHECLE